LSEPLPLIPQPHGGALKPWQPGRGPSSGYSSFKAAKKAVLAELNSLTVGAGSRLRELIQSPDDRVAMVAVKEVLDRTLGTPTYMPQEADEGVGTVDLTRLSAADRAELSGALATIKRLTGRGPGGG